MVCAAAPAPIRIRDRTHLYVIVIQWYIIVNRYTPRTLVGFQEAVVDMPVSKISMKRKWLGLTFYLTLHSQLNSELVTTRGFKHGQIIQDEYRGRYTLADLEFVLAFPNLL